MRGHRASAALVVLFFAWAGTLGPAQANCQQGRFFSTKNPSLYGGENRIATPGYPFGSPERSVSDRALGYFWSLGFGNPGNTNSPTWDNDCGTQADGMGGGATGRCGSPILGGNADDWWKVEPLDSNYHSYIGGNLSHWAAETADGCVDWDGSVFNPGHSECEGCMDVHQCMVVLLADDPGGDQGFFVVLADEADSVGFYALNQAYDGPGPGNSGTGETIQMVPVPEPLNVGRTVVNSTHVRVGLELDEPALGEPGGRLEACPDSLEDGVCGDPVPCLRTFCGYAIYTQVKDADDPAPDSRGVLFDEGWTRKQLDFTPLDPLPCETVGPDVAPFGVQSTFDEIPCAPGQEIYICSTLILDSGFQTPYCSADVRLTCGADCMSDADCSDGKYCNGDETCDGGDCQPGSSPCGFICDEESDSCELAVGCNDNNECDDLLFCNGVETCEGGFCRSGAAATCPGDGVGCTVESCDESTDSCISTPDHALCGDARFCTGTETCDPVGDCQDGSDPCPPPAGMSACDENIDDCLAAGTAAGRVPNGDPDPETALMVEKTGADITLTWKESCKASDVDYAIYEGRIGGYHSHSAIDCTDDDDPLTEVVTPSTASSYYLVVSMSADREGSYGTDSGGGERPPGYAVCKPKEVGPCD